MRNLTRILLALCVLLAPGWSVVDALGGYADAQESLTLKTLEAEKLKAENAGWQQRTSDLSDRLEVLTFELKASTSPGDRAALEEQVEVLDAQLESAIVVAEEFQAKSEAADLAKARAEVRKAIAKEQLEANGQVIAAAADATGGPAAGAIARVGILTAGSLAAAWGAIKASIV